MKTGPLTLECSSFFVIVVLFSAMKLKMNSIMKLKAYNKYVFNFLFYLFVIIILLFFWGGGGSLFTTPRKLGA